MIRARSKTGDVAVLRSLALGDRWQYDVTGTLTRPGSAPLALRGTIVVTVVADTLLDARGTMLSFVQALEIATGDGCFAAFPAPDMAFTFVQDPVTRDAAILADNMGHHGACRRAATPQVFYPGRWFLGTQYDNRLEFGGGDFVHNTLQVTGQVTVDTPLGSFASWVAEITSESPVMGRIVGIDWWTPVLGAPACFETTATLASGVSTRLQAMLSQTNVALEQVALVRDHA